MIKHEFRTIKIWKDTWRKLRILAGLTDRSLVQTMDDLVTRRPTEDTLPPMFISAEDFGRYLRVENDDGQLVGWNREP